jgi:hypothetical protein
MSEVLTKYHNSKLSEIATAQIDRILPGELAPTIAQLGLDFPTELQRAIGENISIQELTKMLKVCPLSHRAVEILALRATPTLGDYKNGDDRAYYLSRLQPRTTKQEWLRSNFDSMSGSLERTIGMMIRQATFFGHSVAEIITDNQAKGFPNQWRLARLKVLEPERYRFAGRLGDIDRIVYYPQYQSPFPIPIEKLLVIYIPRADNPEDPYGDCAGARAYPFYLARQMMYKSWVLAGQRQATGHVVYKTRSEKPVQLLNTFGQPIRGENGEIKTGSAVYAIAEMEKKAQAGAPRVIDKDTDVSTVNPGGGENFFNTFLPHLQKMVLYCYGLPSTILDDTQSGIGNATINSSHMLILDSQIKGLMDICKQEIIEKIVRPLLVANFGGDAVADLGEFAESKYVDPNQSSMMVSNIMQATMQGFIDPTDLEAINRVRELSGLSVITREEWDVKQMAKYELEMQQQQQTDQENRDQI